VRRNHAEVGVERREGAGKHLMLEALWLQHGYSAPDSQRLDRCIGDLLAAAARPIGLRDDTHHLVARLDEPRAGRHGERRRAQEGDPKPPPLRPPHSPRPPPAPRPPPPAGGGLAIFAPVESPLTPGRGSAKNLPAKLSLLVWNRP